MQQTAGENDAKRAKNARANNNRALLVPLLVGRYVWSKQKKQNTQNETKEAAGASTKKTNECWSGIQCCTSVRKRVEGRAKRINVFIIQIEMNRCKYFNVSYAYSYTQLVVHCVHCRGTPERGSS